jgi:hypothetical protein
VTAGTVMHRSKLPLRTWFEAIHLLTSHLSTPEQRCIGAPQ